MNRSDRTDAAADASAYQEIAERALAVTGVRWVSVHDYDPEQGVVHIIALAPQGHGRIARAIAGVQRKVPGWDPMSVQTADDVNGIHVRVYRDGETVEAPFRDVTHGVLPRPAVEAIVRVASVRSVLLEPLHVDGEVTGSMAFLADAPFDTRTREAAHAFVRQAELTFEKTRLAEQVSARVDDLLRSGQGFIAADERLRKELSLHLHGKVQTSLLATGFLLDRCEKLLTEDPEQAASLIGEVKAEIDRLRDEEIREVSHLLHPSVIDVALTPALRTLTGRYADRFIVQVDVAPDVAELDQAGQNHLATPLRLTVYRIVEEALANASKHARPTAVSVVLALEDGSLAVHVTDDGVGFDVPETRAGIGLGGIDYRVEEAGGRWGIESASGKGTRVSAWLPIEPS